MNHNNLRKPLFLALIGLACLGLWACTGSAQPQLIASYPSHEEGKRQPVPPKGAEFVYDASIEMEVWNTLSAADRAEELAGDYGGYLVSTQSWRQDGKRHITLVLAVPAPNFEAFYQALLKLGRLQSERISGEWVERGNVPNWSVYSEVTVTFHPRSPSLPELSWRGWNPVRTFERAFRVFLTIFGVLVDILIWATVLVGPFILMGLGVRALMRKRHTPK